MMRTHCRISYIIPKSDTAKVQQKVPLFPGRKMACNPQDKLKAHK